MLVYRLAKEQWVRDLSGMGASKFGARWNPEGIPLLYTAENRALAMTEVAVHFSIGLMPMNYYMITLEIPEDIRVQSVDDFYSYPEAWQMFPATEFTQRVGRQFVTVGEALCLQVPSVVVKGDHNMLINPRHQDMGRVKITSVVPFPFDRRLFFDQVD